MIGKLISAGLGSRIAQSTPGVSEGAGAVLGLAAATVMRRLGPVGMLAAAAGVYLYSQHAKQQDQTSAARTKARKASRKAARKTTRKPAETASRTVTAKQAEAATTAASPATA